MVAERHRAVAQGGRGEPAQDGTLAGGGTPAFRRLKCASFPHSAIFTGLLWVAFAIGKPQPATEILGFTHGILWIAMSLACIAAARLRIVSLRLAVAVAVLGGIGPFFGSWQFIREQRLREHPAGR